MGRLALLGSLALFAAAASSSSPGPSFAPDFPREESWLNSGPLSLAALRGKVVLVEFFTFQCGNCRNVLPHVKEWNERYAARGLRVIGVHTPELDYERDPAHVKAYLERERITWPVVLDPDYAVWNAWENHYWPAVYLIDKEGRVRFRHVGEGDYPETAQRIEALLQE